MRENLAAGDDVFRVVRGGSWYGPSDYARCASRGRYRPVDRRYDIWVFGWCCVLPLSTLFSDGSVL